MKINDLIKQLNALKKVHGNLDVSIINPNTGHPNLVQSVTPAHPLNASGCYDRTKPAYTVLVNTWKQ